MLEQIGVQAKAAARELAQADTSMKNCALLAMADAILRGTEAILAANDSDMAAAREKGLIRSEGKDYVVQDGDIILFRFNV